MTYRPTLKAHYQLHAQLNQPNARFFYDYDECDYFPLWDGVGPDEFPTKNNIFIDPKTNLPNLTDFCYEPCNS